MICASVHAAILIAVEITGAMDLNDDSYAVEFNNFGGFRVSPIGTFDGRFPTVGSTGRLNDISLAQPLAVPVTGFAQFDAAPFARFDLETLA